jgi:hypothetical protein
VNHPVTGACGAEMTAGRRTRPADEWRLAYNGGRACLEGCWSARTSLGVLQREHRISSHEKPLLIAWSIVGDGSIGSPSDHILSFQLSQSSRSACCSMVSALTRISTDCAARIPVIARALPSSFERASRSSPDGGVG